MKKYLMFAAAAAMVFTSCSKTDDVSMTRAELDKSHYDKIFNQYIEGRSIASNQTWGFSTGAYSRAAGITRSQAAPDVLEATQPYDEAWVADYLTTAKEPTDANMIDNYDDTYYQRKQGTYSEPYTTYYSEFERLYPQSNYGYNWNKTCAAAKAAGWEHFNDLFELVADINYVTNFKITGTQNGSINVVATEDADGDPRTVVVTGTWNLTAEQKVGGGGRIIVANGGKINLASGANLNSVNEAQIVVLPGGEISGAGTVAFHNGTDNSLLSGNWGTINVGTFNNNGGNFYNYGTLKANKMDGGAGNSRYYNHSVISINETGSSANIRIYNGCQFYVKNNARIRNYEGINGSALVVDGELMFSSSEDGTSNPTYVGLAGGALIKCATLYNNGTSWSGPTGTEYAALEITDKIVYLNWEQDAPQTGGYFENNIYVKAGTWTNVPTGNGYQSGETSTADYKFFHIVANCTSGGTGNVTKVTEGSTEFIPKDDDFVKGESGCTPGFTADVPSITPPNPTADIRIIAEDLSAEGASDFDFNDIVLDVKYGSPARVWLVAAGGTLPLRINGNDNWETHKLFGVGTNEMVNTGAGPYLPIVEIADLKENINSPEEANSKLKLEVYKNGEWQELTAERAEPACKLAVDQTFKILSERQSIKVACPLFLDWVESTNFASKWWPVE